jgi:peptide/nickel transport system permease protein
LLTYLARRLVLLVPLLLGVTLISFVIMNLSPGDPMAMYLDPDKPKTPEQIAAIRRDLGLDKPLMVRYFLWLGRLLRATWATRSPVNNQWPKRLRTASHHRCCWRASH